VSEVVALHRAATVLWSPADGEVQPIYRLPELHARVSAWRTYGQVARVQGHSADGREAGVTALGDDGWVVRVRDAGMVKGGWTCSRTLTRLLEDGSTPTLMTGSQWYAPDESSDLAGATFVAEQIQFYPAPVAHAAWAWLAGEPLPRGYAAGKASHDHVVVASVTEAFAWIADSGEHPWPAEAAQAAVDLAAELNVDRVIVTSPGQITVRVQDTGRRVRFQYRARSDVARVRVIGMVDELGHEYSMSLPGRDVLRVRRRRLDPTSGTRG